MDTHTHSHSLTDGHTHTHTLTDGHTLTHKQTTMSKEEEEKRLIIALELINHGPLSPDLLDTIKAYYELLDLGYTTETVIELIASIQEMKKKQKDKKNNLMILMMMIGVVTTISFLSKRNS
jgi:hypothetical protein